MHDEMRIHVLKTFITHLLVHIRQKKKIALEIGAKIASVNGPLGFSCKKTGSIRDDPYRTFIRRTV
jgi:hypothetical protein